MTDRGWSWLRVVGIPIHLRSDTIFDSIARAFRESAVADVCGCNLNEVKVKALNPGQVLDAVMLKFGEARFHLQVPEIFSDGGAGSEPDSGSGGGGGGGCCLYGQEKSRWEGEKVSEDFLRGDVVTETEGVCKFDGKRPLRVGKGPALSNFGDSAPRTSASISEEKVDKRVCSDLMEVFWKGSNFLPQVIKEVGRKEVVGLAKVAGGKPFEDPVSPSGPGSSSTDDALTREEVERVGLGLSQRFRPDNGFESPSLLSKGEIKRGTMLSDRAEEAVEEGLAAVREKDPEKEQLDALVSQFQVVSEVLQLELNSSKVEARERVTDLAVGIFEKRKKSRMERELQNLAWEGGSIKPGSSRRKPGLRWEVPINRSLRGGAEIERRRLFGLLDSLPEDAISVDNLIRRGFQLSNRCILCSVKAESIRHLFVECSFASQMWSLLSSRLSLIGPFPGTMLGFVTAWKGLNWDREFEACGKALLHAFLWCVWSERNSRTFRDEYASSERVLGRIGRMVGEWCSSNGSMTDSNRRRWEFEDSAEEGTIFSGCVGAFVILGKGGFDLVGGQSVLVYSDSLLQWVDEPETSQATTKAQEKLLEEQTEKLRQVLADALKSSAQERPSNSKGSKQKVRPALSNITNVEVHGGEGKSSGKATSSLSQLIGSSTEDSELVAVPVMYQNLAFQADPSEPKSTKAKSSAPRKATTAKPKAPVTTPFQLADRRKADSIRRLPSLDELHRVVKSRAGSRPGHGFTLLFIISSDAHHRPWIHSRRW
ncbi:hypothetical protein LINPERHAP1_LOCUS28323 [Linum perenne]